MIISEDAKKARSAYYKRWRVEHPEDTRAAQLRYWEKKAKAKYGKKYKAPAPGEEMSAQARELRNEYYMKYRTTNSEAINKAKIKFWEKLATDPDGKERR